MIANRPMDREVYETELSAWLPPKIIDCHVHVVLGEHHPPMTPDQLKRNWAMEVGEAQTWASLREVYDALFPKQEVAAIVFGTVMPESYTDLSNEYVLSGATDPRSQTYGLFVSRPEWPASRIEKAMSQGFRGIKPYPDLAGKGTQEVSIYDFVPREHLSVLNELGGIMMLHLPRAGRLGDPDNIREVLEIHEVYPGIKLIVAHVGRAYCLPTAERGLPPFADAKGVYFDTSANLNADVFHLALEIVGAERLLFGSDLPITLMRGVREYDGERYINFTNGPYSWNTNRKGPEEEAKYTYYLYEEIKALIEAVKQAGLDREALERIMYSNCARLLRCAP